MEAISADRILALTADAIRKRQRSHPEFAAVTVSYAQTIDGCITQRRGFPTRISSAESMALTHAMRALHDAILVGIGTIRADNPSLTVRLVDGQNPQPIVLDTLATMPLGSRLLTDPTCTKPIVCVAAAHAGDTDVSCRIKALEAAGAWVLRCRSRGDTHCVEPRIDFCDVVSQLLLKGFRSVMVEGGATIIRSMLADCLPAFDGSTPVPLVCNVVVTVGPRYFLRGLTVAQSTEEADVSSIYTGGSCSLDISPLVVVQVGQDVVLQGAPCFVATEPRAGDQAPVVAPGVRTGVQR
jgi:riboflavin-specific deaminase-like protein